MERERRREIEWEERKVQNGKETERGEGNTERGGLERAAGGREVRKEG